MHLESSRDAPHGNRLHKEKSPYLLQHAHNPVDWYPWGEEAFKRSRKEGKPIFLSVGYSACHWCHVMERESFENKEIADFLNANFVCIKVDREERPDIDRIYMEFVQATTGRGGWPMSVWLTPDRKPFYGGTYYPPDSFKHTLRHLADAWMLARDKLIESADYIIGQIRDLRGMTASLVSNLDERLLDKGYEQLAASYDPAHGGFGGPPKFPNPVTGHFLLHYYWQTGRKNSGASGSDDALRMTLFTLRRMAEGGIHDAVGGGFHRYSVDADWHVPHFEKMLYDQAQLALLYLEAYQVTHDTFHADVARDILEYVRSRMTGAEGQFYSSEDADSPTWDRPDMQTEGAFYVWTRDEIVNELGKSDAEIVSYYYGVTSEGNVSSTPYGEFNEKNILSVRHTLEETADAFGITRESLLYCLAEARARLLKVQSARPRPFLDDKTLTSWNSLMISAFVKGYEILETPDYLTIAQRATAFLEVRLHEKGSGRLFHRYRAGEAAVHGHLDDYAFFIQALLDLYEADFDAGHLHNAIALQEIQDALFWDNEGGYCFVSKEDSNIILNIKEGQDGQEPSANAISVLNLLRLAQVTQVSQYREKAEKTLTVFSQTMPGAMPQMLVALGFFLDKPKQIIIAGKSGAPDTKALLREVYSRFIPNRILLLADGGPGQLTLSGWQDYIQGMQMMQGRATAFVCENNACKVPTNDVVLLREQLDEKT